MQNGSTQVEQIDEPLWEPARCPDFVAALCPEAQIPLDRHSASFNPAVQGAHILDAACIGFQFVQHGRDRGLCWDAMNENSNVVPLRQPDEIDDPLTNILRSGARALLAQAVELEAEAVLAAVRRLRLPH